jgi:predicted dehydrogenase
MSSDRIPIRVGIVGTGFAAQCHADALRRLNGVRLVGVASRSPGRASEAAAEMGAAHAYRDVAELIDDAEIDAVHICSTNHLHAQLAATALQAGKHVICEKPLAVDSDGTGDLVAIADTAAASGTLSAVCFNYRHYPIVQRLRTMVADREHGPVHFVHGSYLQDWLLYDSDWNWRVDPAENGPSRAMADIGSHWLDLVQHVTGQRVEQVLADLGTLHKARRRPLVKTSTFEAGDGGEFESVAVDSEDFGSVLIQFADGTRGTFSVSQVSAGRRNRLTFELDAAEAALAWDQERPDTAWIGRRRAPSLEYPRDAALGVELARLPAGHNEGWRETFYNLFADFYAAVGTRRDGGEPETSFATFADGHHTTLLVEAILESHRSRSWVSVGERR